ncbi:hypothetical protein [Emticicia sp. C21]|uniref:hypothetical protein n=1 Tax=Emticicia sp. C21 TaxID=2302915 RepID=UPI0011C0F918|nr:hypothetical protein [Emticicia sp. C21]
MARRCQLMQVKDGVTTALSTAQTIYRIGYAQAQCETDIITTVACPDPSQLPGSDSSRRIPVTRHVRMLKPVALDWSENKPGPAAWDTSRIATTDSRPEVLLTAATTAANKPQAVVPLITRAQLDSHTDTDSWSEALADAMYNADNDSIERKITSCNNAGDPCGVAMPQKGIEIWVEGERRLWPYLGDAFNMRNLTCSVAPHERCNPILGETQSMCSGECGPSQVNNDLYVSGGNFEELINSYFSYVETPLPAGNAILRVAPATTVPLFNDPNALCDLASTDISNLMIFGTYKEDQASFGGVRECPGLPGKTYTDSRDMFDDAINAYLARGGNLMIFTDHVKMGNENVPFFIEDISANIFRPDGKVTTTLQNWLTDAPPPGDPCTVIPKG